MNFINKKGFFIKNEKYSALGKPRIHMQFVLSSTWPCVEIEMVYK